MTVVRLVTKNSKFRAFALALPCLFLLIIFSSSKALATDGYFADGYGINAKAMAGAVTALPQDTIAAATNPAGMVELGNRLDIGLEWFYPSRQYTVTGAPSGAPGTFPLAPGTVSCDCNNFFIPDMGYNRMIDKKSSVGISVYGNGGMNTSFPASAGGGVGTFGAGETGVNLEQLFVAGTYARKLSPSLDAGVSLIFGYQDFKAAGLANFGGFVSDGTPDNLTNRGKDSSTGFGVRVGVQAKLTRKLTLGAAYQPKMHMSDFDKYSDLFAQHGNFDIPANGSIGLAYKLTPTSVVDFDVRRLQFSDVPSVGNPFANLFVGMAGNPSYLLGGDQGPGFGWRNMTVYKLGYQKQLGAGWTWRSGISYGKEPIRSSDVLFNIICPAVQEWHFAVGASKVVKKNQELEFAVVYSPTKTVSGPNPLEAPGQQTIDLQMHQWEVGVGWSEQL